MCMHVYIYIYIYIYTNRDEARPVFRPRMPDLTVELEVRHHGIAKDAQLYRSVSVVVNGLHIWLRVQCVDKQCSLC